MRCSSVGRGLTGWPDAGAPPRCCATIAGTDVASTIRASARRPFVMCSPSPKQARRELLETAPPRQPFVRRPRRLVIDVLDPCLGELFAERLGAGPFRRADAEEQDLYLLVERRGIGKDAAVGDLRIEPAAAA